MHERIISLIGSYIIAFLRYWFMGFLLNLVIGIPYLIGKPILVSNIIFQIVSLIIAMIYFVVAPFIQLYFAMKVLRKNTWPEKIFFTFLVTLFISILYFVKNNSDTKPVFIGASVFIATFYSIITLLYMWRQDRKRAQGKEKYVSKTFSPKIISGLR